MNIGWNVVNLEGFTRSKADVHIEGQHGFALVSQWTILMLI